MRNPTQETPPAKESTELFIVDNSESDWKVGNYLHEWADLARSMDIATVVARMRLIGRT